MSASLRLLLRMFVFCSFTFGGAMGSCLGFVVLLLGGSSDSAKLVGVFVGVAVGVPYGVAMTVYLGLGHVLAVRRLGYCLTDETLSVCQRRQLTVDLPFSEVFALCLASVRHLGATDVEEETDVAAGVIRATKRRTFWESSERIRIELRGRSESSTGVAIECSPCFAGVIGIDFGASLRSLDALVGFLLAHGANGDGAFAAKRSEHLLGSSSAHVEGRPSSVRQGEEEGPAPP